MNVNPTLTKDVQLTGAGDDPRVEFMNVVLDFCRDCRDHGIEFPFEVVIADMEDRHLSYVVNGCAHGLLTLKATDEGGLMSTPALVVRERADGPGDDDRFGLLGIGCETAVFLAAEKAAYYNE